VRVQRESLTLAPSPSKLLRMYRKLAGMTGTRHRAEEFQKIYGLDVVAIPTHRPRHRENYPEPGLQDGAVEVQSVVDETPGSREGPAGGWWGTVGPSRRRRCSVSFCGAEGVPQRAQRQANTRREAGIIAQAGRSAPVTIATNMAGPRCGYPVAATGGDGARASASRRS